MDKYLTVLNKDEVALGYLTNAKNVEVRERLNGESLISFELPFSTTDSAYVVLENYVKYDNQLYVIKSIEESDNGKQSLIVRAVHVYIELVDEYIDRTVELFGTTIQNAVYEALLGTEFTSGIETYLTDLHDVELTEMSVLKALQVIRETWDCDIWFSNRTVYFGSKGIEGNTEIRYGKNLKTLRKPTDSSKVITRLFPYGRDGLTIEGVNSGIKYIDSPNIGLYRRPKSAEVRFNDIDDPNELLQEAQRYLSKHDTIDVSYQTDFIEMQKLGYEPESIGLGDAITLTHIPFNMQTIGTRIVELTRFPFEPRPTIITLSSFIETSIDDNVALRRRQREYERYNDGRNTVFENTRSAVNNGEIFIKDKYGQVIVNQEGVKVEEIDGYGIISGGTVAIQNITHNKITAQLTSNVSVGMNTVIQVDSTEGFPDSGNLHFVSPYGTEREYFYYDYKTATSFVRNKEEYMDYQWSVGKIIYSWTEPHADVVVSKMSVLMPDNTRFIIPETRFENRPIGNAEDDWDGWGFRTVYVDVNGVLQFKTASTLFGVNQYPSNHPEGSVRVGYMLVGCGESEPDGSASDAFDFEYDSEGFPVFKQFIYHDVRYRDERVIRTNGQELLIGGAPYGSQILNVSVNPGEYKTFFIRIGKGRRSANVSLTLTDGADYDNYSYGANLTVGRRSANNADGQGRPLYASYTDADNNVGHVQQRRDTAPYGIHVLSPRVWNRSYTMLYDADLTPDPNDAEMITLKLLFYNYSTTTAESFDLRINWHAL